MENIVLEAGKYVINLLNEKLDTIFVYHNLAHTQRVVAKSKELSELSNISDKEKEHLELAAWFHDTGFTKGSKAHEKESSKIASAFLEKHNYPENDIKSVVNLILATEMDYEPSNVLEKNIRDASEMPILLILAVKIMMKYVRYLEKNGNSPVIKPYQNPNGLMKILIG